jgi:hypothetical protein
MSRIFVSYRRVDAQGWAGRLGADLAAAFGDVARFFDLASIPPGVDFLLEIERSLTDACAVLVLIGPRWLDLRDKQGRRRLDDPDDMVAAEVVKALSLGVPVIPVLLGGAAMPTAADLPEPLRPLHRRNAFELSDLRWEFDRDRLFAAIEAATPLRRRAVVGPAVGVSVGGGLELRDAEVGRVTGVRGAVPAGGVDVLRDAKVTGGKIDAITGVEIAPPADRNR